MIGYCVADVKDLKDHVGRVCKHTVTLIWQRICYLEVCLCCMTKHCMRFIITLQTC